MVKNPNSSGIVRSLIKENKASIYPTFAYSVLDDYIHGEIFIDEYSALIGTSSGIYAVVGNENSEHFLSLLMNKFKSRKIANQRFTLFSSSEKWDERIKEHFQTELKPLQRYSFHFNEDNFLTLNKAILPDNFQLTKMNEAALQTNQVFNRAYITQYWDSAENFMQKGIGFSAMHNGAHASECVSIFSSLDFAEIDIATDNHFRGRGLAQCTAEAFILECLKQQVTPRWDCDIHNLASIKLAGKLGFANPVKYSVFVGK